MALFIPHNSRTSFRNEPFSQSFDGLLAPFERGFHIRHRGFDFRVARLVTRFEKRGKAQR